MWISRISRGRRVLPLSVSDVDGICAGWGVAVVVAGPVAGPGAAVVAEAAAAGVPLGEALLVGAAAGCDCEEVAAAGLLDEGSVGDGGWAAGGACVWLGEAIFWTTLVRSEVCLSLRSRDICALKDLKISALAIDIAATESHAEP